MDWRGWLFLVLVPLSIHGSLVTEVEDFVSTVRHQRHVSFTTMMQTETDSKNMRSLLSAGAAIGNLLASALREDHELSADEKEALAEIHSNLVDQLYDIESREMILERTLDNNYVGPYQRTVAGGLYILLKLFSNVTRPDLSRLAYKDDFKKTCTSENGTSALLEYMDRTYRLNCPLPSRARTAEYIGTIRGLREFCTRNGIDVSSRGFRMVEQDLLDRIDDNMKQISTLIKSTPNMTSEDAIVFLEGVVKQTRRKPVEEQCIIQTVLDSKQYEKEPAVAVVEQIRLHTLELAVLSMACWNVSSDGREDTLAALIDKITATSETMLNTTITYVQNLQEWAWPAIHIEKAIMALGDKEVSYDEAARIVRKQFMRRGRESDNFQVVAFEGLPIGRFSWRPFGSENIAQFHHNYKRYLINRYSMPITEKVEKMSSWLPENRDAIWKELDANYDNENTGKVLGLLQDKFNIVNEERYSASLLMYKNIDDHGHIDYGVMYNTILSNPIRNNTDMVDYFPPSYRDNHFILFLFA